MPQYPFGKFPGRVYETAITTADLPPVAVTEFLVGRDPLLLIAFFITAGGGNLGDPKLTAKAYVDQAALPLMESVSKMPGMSNGNSLSPDSSLESGFSSHFGSQPVASNSSEASSQVTLDELLSRLLSHLGAICPMAPAVGIEPTT